MRRADLDIAVANAVGNAAKPAAVAVKGHRNLAFEQRRERRRGDRHIAEQRHIRNVDEAHLRFAVLLVGDLERFAFLADPGVLGLDDQRQRLVRRNGDRPRRERRAGRERTSSGKTDRHERAARAFRTVLERRRDSTLRNGQTQLADRRPRRRSQRLVQRDAHALAALGIIDGAFLDAVAVLFEQQRLEADLDALRFVGALRNMRALAPLVIDRRHHAILGLGDVELGDDAQRGGGKRQRPADDLVARRRFVRFERLGRRQRRARAIDAGMNAIAFDRVARLRPFALRPHEISEPRAIDELVHHPRRNERRVAGDRRRGEVEFELVVGHRPRPAEIARLMLSPRTARLRNGDRGRAVSALHRSAELELRAAEQSHARSPEGLDDFDVRSREPAAPAFGEKISFQRRRRIVHLRMPRHAIGRQAFP